MTKRILITELSEVNIRTVSNEDLVDVSGITFDNAVPQQQRAAQILELVKNPYCFRMGDMGVKLEFAEDAPQLQNMLTSFLIHKRRVMQ